MAMGRNNRCVRHISLHPVDRYYEMITGVRAALIAAGQEQWASRLLRAERGASTAGEAISRIGLTLEELAGSDVPEALGIRDNVDAAVEYGRELWDASSR